MLMSVRERTREIGTMMAVGMRRRYILSLFVSEAAILGLFGSLLGILFGGLLVHHFGTVGVPLRATGGDSVITLYPFVSAQWVLRLLLTAVSGRCWLRCIRRCAPVGCVPSRRCRRWPHEPPVCSWPYATPAATTDAAPSPSCRSWSASAASSSCRPSSRGSSRV